MLIVEVPSMPMSHKRWEVGATRLGRIQRIVAVVTLAALVVVTLWGRPAAAQTGPGPYLIVPGQRLGPIELGMRIDEATALLGTPLFSADCYKHLACDHLYLWDTVDNQNQPEPGWNGFSISTRGGVVAEIRTVNPQYHTAQGIHVDSTERQVRQMLGPPRRFENRTETMPQHPSCCYVHWLQYQGMEMETGYAPGICPDVRSSACWTVSSITVIPTYNPPHATTVREVADMFLGDLKGR